MCGRFALVEPIPDIARLFDFDLSALEAPPPGRARFNIAPQTPVLAVRSREGRREGVWLRWGLVPAWARDAAIGQKMFNARSEEANTRPAYRSAFARRRCLVPASAFYEWGQARSANQARQPYAFRLAARTPFALGGLWEENLALADGTPLRTLSILTTAAVPPVEALHHRMPVIVPQAAYDLWLAPETPAGAVQDLCLPSVPVQAYAVTVAMNRARFEEPACLAPVDPVDPVET